MNERDKYINDLVAAEQAQRTYADDCREVSRYMEGRDRKGDVVPYVAPESETRDMGDLTPSQKRGLKMFSVVAPVTGISVGVAHVLMTGALNSVLGLCIGGGFALSLLSGLFGGSTGSAKTSEVRRGGDNITVNNTINIQR